MAEEKIIFDIDGGKTPYSLEAEQAVLGSFEMLTNYAQQILQNKDEANRLIEKVYEAKVVEAVTPLVKVSNKSVTIAELNKILAKKAK